MLHFFIWCGGKSEVIAVIFSYGPCVGQLYVEHNDAILLVVIPAAQSLEIASSVSLIW